MDSKYISLVREDFGLLICPKNMVKQPSTSNIEIDRSNTAEKGYIISSKAKRKIRCAAYSLYCKATRDEQLNLRFVTFTFPPLPKKYEDLDVIEQDKLLHNLFKKFIDNERKESHTGIDGVKTKLDKYLWVNERQDGERIKGIAEARNILHYHCLFRYTSSIDYWTCNIRWLNLLHRNDFQIFNNAFLIDSHKETREKVIKLLNSLDYRGLYEIRDTLKIQVWRLERGFIEESIFLQPVDFDKKPIKDVESLGKYLSAYITKEKPISELTEIDKEKQKYLKIYARRWGCSRGLVIQKDVIQQQFTEAFPKKLFPKLKSGRAITNIVDEKTGEIVEVDASTLTALHQQNLLKMYRLDKKSYAKKFDVEIRGEVYECYYFPPQFKLWAQIPSIRRFFKNAFNYNII